MSGAQTQPPPLPRSPWWQAPLAIGLVAVLLRLISGVYFANYDTLYALLWGQQLAHGHTPQYGIAVAPTPHPLIEALGFVLSPLGPRTVEDVVVVLGYLALAGCGWVIYLLGSAWFGRWAGALAALLLLTRVPVLSYGVRAYVDVPYLLALLGALLVETRHRRAGAPVLVLLGVAGLLRPEAWAFSGLYWLYLYPSRSRAQMARLAALAAAAPLLWVLSDWLVTGDALWSLRNTRHTAAALDRKTGLRDVPLWIPRRIGEILQPPVLLGAALGGILTLAWLRDRARLGAIVGFVAVGVFALFASAGLPINTRYAFLTAAILCLFCGAGVFGWQRLPRDDPHRRVWMIAGALVALALIAFIPSQISSARRERRNLDIQQRAQNDLVALVQSGAISLRCAPIGVPNHAPIPLLALRLQTSPTKIVSSADSAPITRGTYVAAANYEVAQQYILDTNDPGSGHVAPVPPGFKLTARNRSFKVYQRCG